MNILVTGGTGILGSELKKLIPDAAFPERKNFDISNFDLMYYYLSDKKIDLIINCAAETNTVLCETNLAKALNSNVTGPVNLVKLQDKYNFKLVHISTDYVFDGSKGDYKNTDLINPISNYSKSKAAGELVVRMSKNSLIIRTSFFPKEFTHDKAFVDQVTTKDFVDIIAPMVLEAAISGENGVLHVGTKKDTVYNKVKKRKPNVKKISIKDINSIFIPKDVSLI